MTDDRNGTTIPDHEALRAVRAACLGELGWVGPAGAYALAVVPLVLGRRPAVALPYAWERAVRALADAGRAVLTLTDPRMTGSGWRPLALTGRVTVVDDLDGGVLVEQLLDQELRKHPPSRVLAGSPLLRRENWWYVPRLVVELDVTGVAAAAVRTDPVGQAVLVSAATATADPTVRADVVAVDDWDARPLPARALGSPPGLPRESGPAALLATDASVPDLERWSPHLLVGRWDGDRAELGVASGPPGSPGLPAPLGLWARWRRQRELERACRAGIATAEAAARRV